MKSPDKLCLTALVFSCVLAAGVHASEPMAVTIPWQKPGGSAPSTEMTGAQAGQLEGAVKGATGALEKAGKVGDMGSKALDFSKSLSATDDRLKADYNPPGAPGVPSTVRSSLTGRTVATPSFTTNTNEPDWLSCSAAIGTVMRSSARSFSAVLTSVPGHSASFGFGIVARIVTMPVAGSTVFSTIVT